MRTLFSSYFNFSISRKITLSFSVILLFFTAILWVNWNNINKNKAVFERYSQMSREATLILNIDHKVANFYTALTLYSSNGHQAEINKTKRLYTELLDELKHISNIIQDEERLSIIRSLHGSLAGYKEYIQDLIEERKRFEMHVNVLLPKASEKMNGSIYKAYGLYHADNNSALKLSLDFMEKNFHIAENEVKSFLVGREQKYKRKAMLLLQKVKPHLDNIENNNVMTDASLQATLNLKKNLDDYIVNFKKVTQSTRAYLYLVNVVIAGEISEFINLSSQLKGKTLHSLSALENGSKKEFEQVKKITSVASFFALMLGFIISIFLGRSLSLPITKISETFALLIDQQKVIHIPGLERQDEIGKLAQAASLLKDMSNENYRNIYKLRGLTKALKIREKDLQLRSKELEKINRMQDEIVKERTIELETANIELSKASQAKSDFLANMSHELRTPMHGILSYANMGVSRINKVKTEKLLRYFSNIQVSGTRLMSLLNDLLDLAKLESGKMDINFGPASLYDIAKSCVAEQKARLDEQHQNVVFLSDNFPGEGEFDSARIGQVVTNFLSNAIKFSPENEVIEFSINPSELISYITSDDEVEREVKIPALSFSVKDYGRGIPKGELELVFDKFEQGSDSVAGTTKGTGLGLPISKEIIELHQGKVWAENNADSGGAVFSFIIPIQQINNQSFEKSMEKLC